MPVSVKKLLADLIEMYRIWGEMIYLFKQKDLQPVYIIQFDELFENRIAEPLEEAEVLRKRLSEHFEQIKYDSQDFNIQFEDDIYKVTAELRDLFNVAFKVEPRITFFHYYPGQINNLLEPMKKLQNGLLKWAGFLGTIEIEAYTNTINLLHKKFLSPIDKELPSYAVQMMAKFIPGGLEIQTDQILKFINNKAVAVIMMRLFSQEPWKTISNPEAFQKVFGNIESTNDERFKKIFNSPVALQSLNALQFTKQLEEKFFVGNREFIEGIAWWMKIKQGKIPLTQARILLNIYQGKKTFIDLISIAFDKPKTIIN